MAFKRRSRLLSLFFPALLGAEGFGTSAADATETAAWPALPSECQEAPLEELRWARDRWPAGSIMEHPARFRSSLSLLGGCVWISIRHNGSGASDQGEQGEASVLVWQKVWSERSSNVVAENFRYILNLLRRTVARWPALVPHSVDLAITPGDTGGYCLDASGRFPCFASSTPERNASQLVPQAHNIVGWPNPYFLSFDYGARDGSLETRLPNGDANPWRPRINKIYWRGALTGPDEETDIDNLVRVKLWRLAAQHLHVFDVKFTGIDESAPTIEMMGFDAVSRRFRSARAPMDDWSKTMPRFRYVLNVDGVSVAWRGRQLLASGAVVLMQRGGGWVEHFDAHLKPYEHYVPIKADLSDLVEKYEWLEANPDEAERLVQNALEFNRASLQSTQTECYALEAMRVVAAATRSKPETEAELRKVGYRSDYPAGYEERDDDLDDREEM